MISRREEIAEHPERDFTRKTRITIPLLVNYRHLIAGRFEDGICLPLRDEDYAAKAKNPAAGMHRDLGSGDKRIHGCCDTRRSRTRDR